MTDETRQAYSEEPDFKPGPVTLGSRNHQTGKGEHAEFGEQ